MDEKDMQKEVVSSTTHLKKKEPDLRLNLNHSLILQYQMYLKFLAVTNQRANALREQTVLSNTSPVLPKLKQWFKA